MRRLLCADGARRFSVLPGGAALRLLQELLRRFLRGQAEYDEFRQLLDGQVGIHDDVEPDGAICRDDDRVGQLLDGDLAGSFSALDVANSPHRETEGDVVKDRSFTLCWMERSDVRRRDGPQRDAALGAASMFQDDVRIPFVGDFAEDALDRILDAGLHTL